MNGCTCSDRTECPKCGQNCAACAHIVALYALVDHEFDAKFAPVLGRVLKNIAVAQDRQRVVFSFDDNHGDVSYIAEGECCSQSWIEHIEQPPDVSGATIMYVRELAKENLPNGTQGYAGAGDSVTKYQTVFRTDRGDVVLEYRNDSNGYYGGELLLGRAS